MTRSSKDHDKWCKHRWREVVNLVSYSFVFRDDSPPASLLSTFSIQFSNTCVCYPACSPAVKNPDAPECFVPTEVYFSKMQYWGRDSAGNAGKCGHLTVYFGVQGVLCWENAVKWRRYRLETYAWMNCVTILSSVSSKATVQPCRTPG